MLFWLMAARFPTVMVPAERRAISIGHPMSETGAQRPSAGPGPARAM